jgi:hypothetical protein
LSNNIQNYRIHALILGKFSEKVVSLNVAQERVTFQSTIKQFQLKNGQKNMIIADTGFWLALANRDDKHHSQAQLVIQSINEPLIATESR